MHHMLNFKEKKNYNVCCGEPSCVMVLHAAQTDLRRSVPLHQVAYPDVAPVMVLSESSVLDLSSRLENDVTVERFRPNIVISDCEPYEEV